MPEPTDLLAGLGDELAGMVRSPQFEELVARGRRRRRHYQLLGSAVAVVLVAAATGVGLQLSRATAGPPAPPAGHGGKGPVITSSPGGFQPGTVTFVGPDTGWTYGLDRSCRPACGGLALTTNGGLTWTAQPAAGLPAGYLAGARLRFLNLQHGWLWQPGGALYSTHDGGRTWARVTIPGFDRVYDLETSDGYAYATVGNPAGGSFGLARSPADADRWQPVAGVGFPGTATVVLSGSGPSVWAFAGWQALWSRDGHTFGTPALPGRTVVALFAGPGPKVFLLSQNDGSPTVHAYLSTDGGRTFRQLTDPPATGIPVDVAATDTGLFLTESAGGTSDLYASLDGGRTWRIDYSTHAALTDFGFTNDLQGVLVQGTPPGDSSLLMTTDGGRTWRRVAF